jgi:hypothetical protein
MISEKSPNIREELSEYFLSAGWNMFAKDVMICSKTSLPFFYRKYVEIENNSGEVTNATK